MTGPTKPRTCFYIGGEHDENGYIPSVVTEGEPGYKLLAGNGDLATPWYWGKTLQEAQMTCARENYKKGIGVDEALAILVSSRWASNA